MARMRYQDLIPVDVLRPNINIFLNFNHVKNDYINCYSEIRITF